MSHNYPHFSRMLEEMTLRAERMQLPVAIESSTGVCGFIELPGGRHIIHGADPGLNSAAAVRLATDKYFTGNFLAQSGLAVLPTRLLDTKQSTGFQPEWLPCVVKPNSAMGGRGVSQVSTAAEFRPAAELATQYDSLILVQPYCQSREFRLVILDGVLLYGYERHRWLIQGDGRKTIAEFLEENRQGDSRNTRLDAASSETVFQLNRKGLSLADVLQEGDMLEIFDAANLNSGGDCISLDNIDENYVRVATEAIAAIGLRYAGVDLFFNDPEKFDRNYKIIEVNATPGLGYLRKNSMSAPSIFDQIFAAIIR